jgi:hypothetical protein
VILASLALFLILVAPLARLQSDYQAITRENCRSVKDAKIYSNAYYAEEGGDVVGIEIALFADRALLFDYEGTPWVQPIPVRRSGNPSKLELRGKTNVTVYEGGTDRPVLQEASAQFHGTLSKTLLKGKLTINGSAPESVRLKSVSHLWGCKATNE